MPSLHKHNSSAYIDVSGLDVDTAKKVAKEVSRALKFHLGVVLPLKGYNNTLVIAFDLRLVSLHNHSCGARTISLDELCQRF